METKGARVPPHLDLLGVSMGIWKSEVREKKVSLFTVKNHILISNRKTRIRGCFLWKGFPAFLVHLRMRPVSGGNSRLAMCEVPRA